MMGLEHLISNLKAYEKGDPRDHRFSRRLKKFLPRKRWQRIGFRVSHYVVLGEEEVIDWTEENVLEQLRLDLEFGWRSLLRGQMINAKRQALVCRSWCEVLEDDVPNEKTIDAKHLFLWIADKHGFDLSGISADDGRPADKKWRWRENL